MEPGVAAALLAAALLHASWHALVKTSGDRVFALAGMNLVSGFAALACLPFVKVPTPLAGAVIAVSVILHGMYKIALARLYTRADFSRGYPLARGVTPLIAAGLGFAFLDETSVPVVGIALVSLGIGGLAFERGGRYPLATLAAAMLVGAAVASYSALDAYGIRIDGDWAGFTAWLIACDSSAFVAFVLATRGSEAAAAWRRDWRTVLVSGGLGVVSFGVFMWALGRAPVGAVAALRETSILFAAFIGAFALREKLTAARLGAALLVMGGTAAIALGL